MATRPGPPRPAPNVFVPVAPAEMVDGLFTFSPDGAKIAIVGNVETRRRLFVRDLDKGTATALPGTDNISGWGAELSADGRRLAFVAGGMLRKVPTLAESDLAVWVRDHVGPIK